MRREKQTRKIFANFVRAHLRSGSPPYTYHGNFWFCLAIDAQRHGLTIPAATLRRFDRWSKRHVLKTRTPSHFNRARLDHTGELMNSQALAQAVRKHASKLKEAVDPDTAPAETVAETADVVELLRTLARIVEGKSVVRAFGAPGGWGYGTPIGKALAAPEPAPSTVLDHGDDTGHPIPMPLEGFADLCREE